MTEEKFDRHLQNFYETNWFARQAKVEQNKGNMGDAHFYSSMAVSFELYKLRMTNINVEAKIRER